METLRVAWKLVRLVEHLLTGALLVLMLASLQRLLPQGRPLPGLVQWWHGRLCRILRLHLETRGEPNPGATLMVANHTSWLDVPVLGALRPFAFLSKSEVRRWPLIGWMSEIAGTLFIERGNHQTSRISNSIQHQLEAGRSVLFFPEGTTSDGTEVRRFHPRLFAAAQRTGARLQPVAVHYRHEPGRPRVAPFIDNEAFLPHLLRVAREPRIHVTVSFTLPLEPSDTDRKTLAEQTRTAILTALDMEPKIL